SSILSPRWRASMIDENTASTMTSECLRVRSETRETVSTSSALVIARPSGTWRGRVGHVPNGPRGYFRNLSASTGRGGRDCLFLLAVPGRLGGPEGVAEGGRSGCLGGIRALAVALEVLPVLVLLHGLDAEADLLLALVDLDDLHGVEVADLDRLLGLLDALLVELAHVHQALDPLVKLDEGAEVGHPDDLALHDVVHLVVREELVPHVGGELLEAQGQALVLGVDVED